MSTNNGTLQPSKSLNLPFWNQIRWRLLVSFLILSALPVIIIALLTLTRISEQSREQVFNQIESVAELKTSHINSWLREGDFALELLITGENRQQQLLDFITTPTADDQETALNALFAEAVQTHPSIEDIFLYDTRGRVISASNDVEIGKFVTRQPYFPESIQLEETPDQNHHFEPPYYDVARNELTMVITHHIFDGEQLVAVIAGRLNMDTLGQIMTDRTGLGDTGETYLVSLENNYFLTPSRFEGYTLTRAYHSEAIDNALNQIANAGTYLNYFDVPVTVLGNYRWIPELQAGLIAEIAEDEALATTAEAVNAIIIFTIIVSVVALVVGLVIATQISRPIMTLAQAARSLALGDLEHRANIQQKDEIGILANTFNNMADELTDKIESLDQQADEIKFTNRQLTIANARIKEEARLKSEFISTMSHELRTPLNAIIGFTGIMLEGMGGEIDDDAEHMLDRINSNSERLLGLINEILDLAKIESGRMDLVDTTMKPASLVYDWQSQMMSLAEKKKLDFKVQVDPNMPTTIYGDPERITQIVINLLSNAFKFTETGTVTLTVKHQAEQWIINVTDTGVGIPPHALNYIFDEFRQIDGSSTRVYGGSGLGLAIVRNLVRMMSGNIHVDSTLGKGSSFTVTLPLQTEQSETIIDNEALLELVQI